jgi:sialic acid synthase
MKNNIYLIGEIGQNHNGSTDIAKQLVDVVARPVLDKLFNRELSGMNAVKLTKRDLSQELSTSMMNKPYDSPHSFGSTYGEHRAFLELSNEEHRDVYLYAKSKDLDFVETICATGAMSLLKLFTPDRLKVASRDLTNLPLISALSETRIPIILSTGMGGKEEIDNALSIITRYHSEISILHCVSEYPTRYENVNLNTIKFLQANYSDYVIGYSDHTVGIAIPLAAVALGAEVIEKHITLDRSMKGSDHRGSLGIDGIERMVRDIRNLKDAMGTEELFISPSVTQSRLKLERSLAAIRDLQAGHILTEDDLHLLSPGDGFSYAEKDKLIGKKVIRLIPKDEIIYSQNIE